MYIYIYFIKEPYIYIYTVIYIFLSILYVHFVYASQNPESCINDDANVMF